MPQSTQKQRQYEEAAIMRFKEGMEHSEIAEQFGLQPQTVRKWFSDGRMEDLKRKYTDKDLFKLQRALEQDIWDAENTAKDLLAEAQRYAESSSDLRQAAEAHMKVRKRKVKLLQELGVIQKPKERREVEEKAGGPTELNINFEQVGSEEELNSEQD